MNYGILGHQGCGKTLCLTLIADIYKQQGLTIFSNYKMDFADRYLEKPQDIFDGQIPYPSFLALDEFYRWCYSFYAWHKMNKLMSDFMATSRKRGFHFGITGVRYMDLDPRIRALIPVWILPKRINQEYFAANIFIEDVFGLRFAKRVRLYAPAIWDKYDTYYIIESFEYEIEKRKTHDDLKIINEPPNVTLDSASQTLDYLEQLIAQCQDPFLRKKLQLHKRHLEGFSTREIMMEKENLGISQPTIARYIQQAREYVGGKLGLAYEKQLAEKLEKEGWKVQHLGDYGFPDLIVEKDGIKEVIAVKYYQDPTPTITISAKKLMSELEYAEKHNLPVRLHVYNPIHGKAVETLIPPGRPPDKITIKF